MAPSTRDDATVNAVSVISSWAQGAEEAGLNHAQLAPPPETHRPSLAVATLSVASLLAKGTIYLWHMRRDASDKTASLYDHNVRKTAPINCSTLSP